MFNFDNDMKAAFLEEAQSLIDDTEAAFIALDEGDHSPDLVDKIFRLAHNFKSSAKTVGLQHLSDFGHNLEDTLTKIKNGQLAPSKKVCTVLLQALDHLRFYVNGLQIDLEYEHDVTEITAALLALNNEGDATSDVPMETAASEPAPELTPLEPELVVAAPAPVAAPTKPVTAVAPPGSPPKPGKAVEEETIKVGRRKLDALLNLIGELVVSQSMVTSHKQLRTLDSNESLQTLNSMAKTIQEIQGISLSLRMTPIAPLFQKLKRIARDASSELAKTINFVTEGEHVEVDKVVMDQIADPLTHLIRNAVDHGIETDQQRGEIGKKEASKVVLKAQQQDDRIVITISDNGRGMCAEKLIAKAVERGLIGPSEHLSEQEAYALIFKPGFSTKEQVTEMSGRGVGMDVVHRAVTDLKGSIQIETKLGEGTCFIISLPLSMSILTGLVVSIDERKYVIPISQLLETVDFTKFRIERSAGKGLMFNLRGEVIQIRSLSSLLHRWSFYGRGERITGTGLVAVHQGKKFSFVVDKICGQQDIVLKKLGSEMQGLPGILAGAILSTGEPGFVLNLHEFIELGDSHGAEFRAA